MPVVRVLLAAALVTGAIVAVGVLTTGTEDRGPATAPTTTVVSTPLTDFDTAGLVIKRASFCPSIGAESVAEALGGDVESSSSYANGEPAQLTRKVEDIAHEYGCTWRATEERTARAWVFAPPVTPRRARELTRLAQEARGCSPITDAPAFGAPSTAVVCSNATELHTSYRGLFGDAWLACSLTAPAWDLEPADLLELTGRWCVAVATAASGPAGTG